MLINESFEKFRFRSFFIEKELICHFLVLFFETSSSSWFSLSINEGISKLSPEASEPRLLHINEIDDDFAYPIQDAIELKRYIEKKIEKIYAYRIDGVSEGCIGLFFDCGDCGFSVLENDGCLSITDGIHTDFQDNVSLVKMELPFGRVCDIQIRAVNENNK